jgi:CspA family cold shock protein
MQFAQYFKLPLALILNFYHSNYFKFFTTTMKTGKVKFFNKSKGFGFIIDNETGKDFFVHVSGLIDEIKDENEVTFELKEGKKGLNAVNVKLA